MKKLGRIFLITSFPIWIVPFIVVSLAILAIFEIADVVNGK